MKFLMVYKGGKVVVAYNASLIKLVENGTRDGLKCTFIELQDGYKSWVSGVDDADQKKTFASLTGST